jgi:hypothetical protein
LDSPTSTCRSRMAPRRRSMRPPALWCYQGRVACNTDHTCSKLPRQYDVRTSPTELESGRTLDIDWPNTDRKNFVREISTTLSASVFVRQGLTRWFVISGDEGPSAGCSFDKISVTLVHQMATSEFAKRPSTTWRRNGATASFSAWYCCGSNEPRNAPDAALRRAIMTGSYPKWMVTKSIAFPCTYRPLPHVLTNVKIFHGAESHRRPRKDSIQKTPVQN